MPRIIELSHELFALALACGLDAQDAGAVARLETRAEAEVLVCRADILRRAHRARVRLGGMAWPPGVTRDPDDPRQTLDAGRALIAAGRSYVEEAMSMFASGAGKTPRYAVRSRELH